MFQGGVECGSLLAAQNSATKRCPRCIRPLYYTATRYISIEVYFLMASNPDRITPDRRLPEATQSTLHHYFIASYTETNAYLLIIDKFPVIRYQATVKQSALILMMLLDLLAAKRLPSFFFAPKNLRSARICSPISIHLSQNN